jgi:hypothetical protein
MKTLKEIKSQVKKMAKLICASEQILPTYGTSKDFAIPHVDVFYGQYHYIVVERGVELEHKSTADLDELLFWVFDDVTFHLALCYELKHRNEAQDCRRIAFDKQIELMARISPAFGEKISEDIARTLVQYPYDDELIKSLNEMRASNETQ